MTSKNFGIKEFHQPNLPAKLAGLFLICLLLLAVFQSSALLTLIYDLEPGPFNELIVAGAENWHGWMQSLGSAGFTQNVGQLIESWHEMPVG